MLRPATPGEYADGSEARLDRLVLDALLDELDVLFGAAALRVDPQHPLEGVERSLVAFHADVDEAETGKRPEVAGLQLQRAVDILQRGLVVPHHVVDGGALVPAFGEV